MDQPVHAFGVHAGLELVSHALKRSGGQEPAARLVEISTDHRLADLERSDFQNRFSGELFVSLDMQGFKRKHRGRGSLLGK